MTALDKALELIEKFKQKTDILYYEDSVPTIMSATKTMKSSKQDALRCVDEIIKTIEPHLNTKWWKEVKEEIMKL